MIAADRRIYISYNTTTPKPIFQRYIHQKTVKVLRAGFLHIYMIYSLDII